MAPKTWLIKVKKTIAHGFDSVRATPPTAKMLVIKKPIVGVLAFEIAGLMSKLLHLWQSLSTKNVDRLRSESVFLEGVRIIVSNDEDFLLSLAYAELVENLKSISKSISLVSKKCEDPSLIGFESFFDEFANSGSDPNNWLLSPKEMESKIKTMDQLVGTTTTLHTQMDQLLELENYVKKTILQISKTKDAPIKEQKIIELRHQIIWQRQEIKYLKDKSLWSRSFDTVISLLSRFIFTILSRIKDGQDSVILSSSASVYPSENPNTCSFVSMKNSPNLDSFFDLNSKILKPPSCTLGAASLSLHYSNLIIVMEKMIKSPQLVGVDARDDLYSMLPDSIRFALRARLKSVRFSACDDPVLASEWRDALQKILGWVSPLAHNMSKWQSERSFKQQKMVPKTNVLLFQTLYFANREKTEAAIIELLVGLNYIWRFETEMNAKDIISVQ